MNHATRRFLTSVVLLVSMFISLNGGALGQRIRQSRGAKKRPRLVLLIVVDQFRYDYLERFGDLFGPRGLKRLMREGALWANANFDYIPTKTAPGHAAFMTGAPPAGTGMAGNEWLDRQTGKKVTSVTDDSAKVLGGGPNESAYSPRLLLASTLGDELRLATNDSAKVIGISDKPRAAILPAGRRANAAYWLSSDVGTVISSDYYFNQLPVWVREFNLTRPLDKYFGARWERLLPEAEYLKRAGPDSPSWENIGEVAGETNAFPHTITGGAAEPGTDFYDALDHSPFLNDVLVSFAEKAIPNEQLGQDDVTDLLTVSLSGNDHVGHRFGPYSQEVMDITLRVDRQIAELLDFVDARVGLRNTLVVFTSDHGVAPLWDHAAALGIGGQRITGAVTFAAIRSAISARYNPQRKSPDPTNDYILKYTDKGKTTDEIIDGRVYFNLAALQRDGISLNEIEQVAGEAALTLPGIACYFTRAQLEDCNGDIPANRGCRTGLKTDVARQALSAFGAKDVGQVSAGRVVPGARIVRGSSSNSKTAGCAGLTDPIARMVQRGFYSRRSGDLVIVPEPFTYLGDSADPANHGSPYSYDTHVPMIIMGSGFRAGRYLQPASPLDIAPTLAKVLGIPAPSKSSGRILLEALSPPRPKTTRQTR